MAVANRGGAKDRDRGKLGHSPEDENGANSVLDLGFHHDDKIEKEHLTSATRSRSPSVARVQGCCVALEKVAEVLCDGRNRRLGRLSGHFVDPSLGQQLCHRAQQDLPELECVFGGFEPAAERKSIL